MASKNALTEEGKKKLRRPETLQCVCLKRFTGLKRFCFIFNLFSFFCSDFEKAKKPTDFL